MEDIKEFLTLTNNDIFYIVDTETTGFSPKNADAIEVSAIRVQNKEGKLSILDTFDSYINPEYPLPENIVEFNRQNNTGICDELLSKAPFSKEVAEKLFAFLGKNPVVVGHNISFDLKFINKLYENCLSRDFFCKETFCTMMFARKHLAGSHKLCDVHKTALDYLKRESNHGYHNSLSDCFATFDVLDYFCKEYGKVQSEANKSKKFKGMSFADLLKDLER